MEPLSSADRRARLTNRRLACLQFISGDRSASTCGCPKITKSQVLEVKVNLGKRPCFNVTHSAHTYADITDPSNHPPIHRLDLTAGSGEKKDLVLKSWTGTKKTRVRTVQYFQQY